MKLYLTMRGRVYPKELGYRRRYRRGFWRGLVCPHLHNATYQISEGPSYLDDSWTGQVCTDCGTVLAEKKD